MIHNSVITASPGAGSLVTLASARDFSRGSVLIVPPGHLAHFMLNGLFVGDYGPGEYELYTTLSPFFPRLQTFMTGGVPALDARVYFVNLQLESQVRAATGEFICRMSGHPFNLAGELSLYIRVADAKRLLASVSNWAGVDGMSFEQYIAAAVRERVQSRFAALLRDRDITELSQAETELAGAIRPELEALVRNYGVRLCSLRLAGLRPRESELALFQQLSEERLRNQVRIENIRAELDALYGGDMSARVRAEVLLRAAENSGGGAAMVPIMWELGRTLARQLAEEETPPRNPRRPHRN